MTHQCDILVAGGGPTGIAAALESAAYGYRTVLAAPSGTHLDDDARTTALMQPAIDTLSDYGVWQSCEAAAAPLKVLRIIDATGRLFRAPPVSFRATEIDLSAFGFNIPNQVLNAALLEAAKAHDLIEIAPAMVSAVAFGDDTASVTLANGSTFETRLVIGADGVRSLIRQAAGIGERTWSYPQTAVVLAFDHERPHECISTEFHTEQGPFTQVPLPGNRSSLVWVMEPERAETMAAMDAKDLARAVEDGLQSTLGKVSDVTAPQTWPLSGMVAHRFGAKRAMLVGQAAHAFPPIGAQGLNLGFRDVADVAAVLAKAGDDPGATRVTRSYDLRRRADVASRTGAVHLLNRSLLTDLLPVQFGRAFGLGVLKNVGPLRAIMMREGVEPGGSLRAARDGLRDMWPGVRTDRAAGSRSSSETEMPSA